MRRVLCAVLCLSLLLACALNAASARTTTTTIRVPSSPLQRPEPTQTPEPAETPEPTKAPQVIRVEGPLRTPAPTETPPPAATPAPVETPGPTETPAPIQTPEPAKERKPLLRLHQIDIGCGDAYLLTVEDTVVLVDCGTNSTDPIAWGHKNPPLFEYIEASGIDHVDVHFVTHWHNDHCYNVGYFSEHYGTEDTVVYGPSARILPVFEPLPNGVYRQLRDGDRLTIGPLEVLCVGPARSDVTGGYNVDSLNFIVYYGEHKFLFTGDWVDGSVRRRWEAEITDIDVFSFPHHALKPLCITDDVYKTINPRVVLIPSNERGSVIDYARNTGHVAREAVYLSQRNGHVLVTSDGVDLWAADAVAPGTFPLGDKVP